MWILLIVKLATFSKNAISTFMSYSKILGMWNLDTIQTAKWGKICLRDFCLGSMQCRKCFLHVRNLILTKIMEVLVKKIF